LEKRFVVANHPPIYLSRRLVVALATFFMMLAPAVGRAQPRDITIESTQRLMMGIFSPTNETMQILAALRTTHDATLVPIFERLGKDPNPQMQVYAMVSQVLVTKDSGRLDIAKFITNADQKLISSALATLIDGGIISNDQLKKVMTDAADPVQRVMAASELSRRDALPDRSVLRNLLANDKDEVRYYAAITLLEGKDTGDQAKALEALKVMGQRHDLHDLPIAMLMVLRVRNEKIAAGGPWVESLATDEQMDVTLRQSAVGTLLALGRGEGSRILGKMIDKEMESPGSDALQEMRLGLIALEFAKQMEAGQIAPLAKSKSTVVQKIAAMARQACEGGDFGPMLLKLMKEGHPLILDWSLLYAQRSDAEHRKDICTTLVGMSTIVDDQRGRDYERAVLAAQKLIEENTPAARSLIASFLRSDNPAIVEAVLDGMVRSQVVNLSELVLPVWPTLTKSAALESAANYAAMILARENQKEALPWLEGMVQGGTVQNVGFRALAGWYYARLSGQTEVLIKRLLAQGK
jgi:hypothetical protein